jgi:hypothetical protein
VFLYRWVWVMDMSIHLLGGNKMVTRTRLAAVIASLGLLLSCLSIGLAPPASADVSDVGGGADGLEASVTLPLGSPLTLGPAPTVTLPPGGGSESDDVLSLELPGVLGTGTVTVVSEGSNGPTGGVVSTATVEGLSVLPALLLSNATVQATCNAGYQPTSPNASTTILGVQTGTLGGALADLVPNPAPNTVIALPGLGSVTLNRQVPVTNGVEVTGMVIDLNVALVATGSIEVAKATCSAVGQGSEEPPVDDPTVIEVDTTDDVVNPLDGLTSLREAVTAASLSILDGATIVLQDDETYDLTICNLLNVVNEDLNLTGDLDFLGLNSDLLGLGGPFVLEGNGSTIEQTCPNDRVFEIFGIGDSSLIDTNVTGGDHPGNGGGISRNLLGIETGLNGTLTFDGGTAEGNNAGGRGGAIYSDGALSCIRATLSENTAVAEGGALFGADSVDVDQCTINRNRGGSGGGIGAASLLAASDVTVRDSTIVANRAQDDGTPGDGIGANVHTDGGLSTEGSIIALSSEPGDGNGDDCVAEGTATSGGGNLGGNDCGLGAGDVLGDHPQLAPLGDNGGPTATMAPVAGSSIIDANPGCTGTDQRDEPRPLGDACDSGSIEEPAPACAQAFSDVSPSHTFYEEICWMEQVGVTTGFEDGTFRPGADITRQSMAAFTFRISGSPLLPSAETTTFPDASSGFVFYEDIEWMADEDITRGYDDGTFRPAAPVTRQAMSAFIYRMAGEPSFLDPTTPSFPDVSPTHPFFHEIEWLSQSGIADGYDDGTFKPERAISRQAMAAFLARVAQEPEVWG